MKQLDQLRKSKDAEIRRHKKIIQQQSIEMVALRASNYTLSVLYLKDEVRRRKWDEQRYKLMEFAGSVAESGCNTLECTEEALCSSCRALVLLRAIDKENEEENKCANNVTRT